MAAKRQLKGFRGLAAAAAQTGLLLGAMDRRGQQQAESCGPVAALSHSLVV